MSSRYDPSMNARRTAIAFRVDADVVEVVIPASKASRSRGFTMSRWQWHKLRPLLRERGLWIQQYRSDLSEMDLLEPYQDDRDRGVQLLLAMIDEYDYGYYQFTVDPYKVMVRAETGYGRETFIAELRIKLKEAKLSADLTVLENNLWFTVDLTTT